MSKKFKESRSIVKYRTVLKRMIGLKGPKRVKRIKREMELKRLIRVNKVAKERKG